MSLLDSFIRFYKKMSKFYEELRRDCSSNIDEQFEQQNETTVKDLIVRPIWRNLGYHDLNDIHAEDKMTFPKKPGKQEIASKRREGKGWMKPDYRISIPSNEQLFLCECKKWNSDIHSVNKYVFLDIACTSCFTPSFFFAFSSSFSRRFLFFSLIFL